MANWDEKFNVLVQRNLEIDGNKEWKMALEEKKNKGTLQMNVRLFQRPTETNSYEGPTKNGFIIPVNSASDVEEFQKTFNDFCEEIKKMF